jgi:hypothetical protein
MPANSSSCCFRSTGGIETFTLLTSTPFPSPIDDPADAS